MPATMPPAAPPSPMGDPSRLTVTQGLWFAAGTALLFALSFWFNRSVIQAHEMFSGVAIFFLPAGVKLMALLIGRQWGALGLLVGNFLISLLVWENVPLAQMVLMAVVWVAVPWAVVETLLRLLRLPPDLGGLRFTQFIAIDATVAVVHGFAFNALLLQMALRTDTDFLSAVWAMALGDFLGSGAFALMVLGVVHLLRRVLDAQRQP